MELQFKRCARNFWKQSVVSMRGCADEPIVRDLPDFQNLHGRSFWSPG